MVRGTEVLPIGQFLNRLLSVAAREIQVGNEVPTEDHANLNRRHRVRRWVLGTVATLVAVFLLLLVLGPLFDFKTKIESLSNGGSNRDGSEDANQAFGTAASDPACIAWAEIAQDEAAKFSTHAARFQYEHEEQIEGGFLVSASEQQRDKKILEAYVEGYVAVSQATRQLWPLAKNSDLKSTMRGLARIHETDPVAYVQQLIEGEEAAFHFDSATTICDVFTVYDTASSDAS